MLSDPRNALYVDGNALFRAIDEMNEIAFKWLDLWRLAASLTDNAVMSRIAFGFSVTGEDRATAQQERTYLRALSALKIDTLVEDPVREFHECSRCGHGWDKRSARHIGADLAIEIMNDAWRDSFDQAWLVTDKLDEANLARKLAQFPDKSLTLVCLRNIPRHLRDSAQLRRRPLTKRHLRAASLAEQLVTPDGDSINRPRSWTPRPSATWNDLEITGL